MSADKRSVTTDALAVLGTIIDDTVGRDAIHLAVEPVVAGQKLYPGQAIGIVAGKAVATDSCKKLGIVDPFLVNPVYPDQKFLLVVFPRQITSLRHVWEHPDFDAEPVKKKVKTVKQSTFTQRAQKIQNELCDEPETCFSKDQLEAMAWIEDYAAGYGIDYEEIMQTAWSHVNADNGSGPSWGGSYITRGAELEGEWTSEEFWTKFEILTGQKIEKYHNFFSCSC